MKAIVFFGCTRSVSASYLYVQSDAYVGSDFFSRWSLFNSADPTHGAVEFVDTSTAEREGLIESNYDKLRIGSRFRNGSVPLSVRAESRAVYNSGLFVATLDHIPTGCGTWPAFWMFGEDAEHAWPVWGEFDIVEGAHRATSVITTLHTGPACNQSSVIQGVDFTSRWATGSDHTAATDCNVHAAGQWGNQGCSQKGPENSMGPQFNAGSGGTFAAEWDPVGGHISTWFWKAGSEPDDLTMKSPDPSLWGLPYSYFRLHPDSCSAKHFQNMRLVFDLTFCGDMGAPTFSQNCPEYASSLTCKEYVSLHPESLADAYWEIRNLEVYQPASLTANDESIIEVVRRYEPVTDVGEVPVVLGVAVSKRSDRQNTLASAVTCVVVLVGITAVSSVVVRGRDHRGIKRWSRKVVDAFPSFQRRRSGTQRYDTVPDVLEFVALSHKQCAEPDSQRELVLELIATEPVLLPNKRSHRREDEEEVV